MDCNIELPPAPITQTESKPQPALSTNSAALDINESVPESSVTDEGTKGGPVTAEVSSSMPQTIPKENLFYVSPHNESSAKDAENFFLVQPSTDTINTPVRLF